MLHGRARYYFAISMLMILFTLTEGSFAVHDGATLRSATTGNSSSLTDFITRVMRNLAKLTLWLSTHYTENIDSILKSVIREAAAKHKSAREPLTMDVMQETLSTVFNKLNAIFSLPTMVNDGKNGDNGRMVKTMVNDGKRW